MVSIVRRMRKLRALLAIRIGPGAAILPPEVTRIHLDIAKEAYRNEHDGLRKFWRMCLPRLKYHNPTVSMTVARPDCIPSEERATLTLHFSSPSPSSSPDLSLQSTASKAHSTHPVPQSEPGALTTTTKTINAHGKDYQTILERVIEMTNARVVRATAEETRQLQELEQMDRQSERDAEVMLRVKEKEKREKAILLAARGSVD